MAVFLSRAYNLAEGPDPGFSDVAADAWFAAEVAALAASGITRGCGDGTGFCPNQDTTRAQMATFLHRAELRSAGGDGLGGSEEFDPATTPPLGDFDLERLVAAAATLDPRAVCPETALPEFLEGVVEVLRIDSGCAVVEYELLNGRAFEEARADILQQDPTAIAVGLPPIDIEPSAVGALDDDDWSRLVGGATLWHPVGGNEGHGPVFYAGDPPAPYDEDQYGPGQWWHLHRLDAATLWQPTGWEFTDEVTGDTWQVPGWGSSEVIVAVLSSGVALHNDLGAVAGSGGLRNLRWLDHVCHHDDRTYSSTRGVGDHGTSLAGVIAAVPGNARDVAGLAPQALILPISLYGRDAGGSRLCQAGGQDITATVAVNAARERGADVISMSFWWNAYDDGPVETDCHGRLGPVCIGRYDTFEAAMRLAQLEGVVTVDSADNCGRQNPDVTTCPEGRNQRAVPSAYPGVIGVAAIDNNDDVADFSTRNEDVDIAAPGVNIRTLAPPQGVKTTNGTSIASPMISAVAAHMKARYPEASGYRIWSALKATARNPDTNRTGGPRTDDYGWGVVDPVAAIEHLTKFYDEPKVTTTTTVPTVEGPTSVTIAVGGSAQGESGCSSRHCRHVSITLDAPADTYDVECWSSRDTEPWGGGRWHWQSSSRWNERGCWYGYPGEQVWVTVGGVRSNTITWPVATIQPQEPAAPTAVETVSAGIWHSCGVRTDGTVTCWGSNEYLAASREHLEGDRGSFEWIFDGKLDAPGGRFLSVSAGGVHSCGVRADQTIECWGGNSSGELDAPGGRFTMVSAGIGITCGVRTDQAIECLEYTKYISVDPDGRETPVDRAVAPEGRFLSVSAGGAHSCGVRADQTIECWGGNVSGELDAPGGRFTMVSVGTSFSCGVRADQTIECWGGPQAAASDPPGGRFLSVSAGNTHSCGVRTDQTVECWGSGSYFDHEAWESINVGKLDAPAGRFLAVSAGADHSCGVRLDRTPACWGLNQQGQANAPAGRFGPS